MRIAVLNAFNLLNDTIRKAVHEGAGQKMLERPQPMTLDAPDLPIVREKLSVPKYLQAGAETISLTLADERVLFTLSQYTSIPKWESQGTVNRLINRKLIVEDISGWLDLTDLGRRILADVRRNPRS